METSVAPHRVKLAAAIPRGRGFFFFAVECACGWSSRLYGSELAANEAYKKHKEGSEQDAE